MATEINPDCVVCVQLEEAPHLANLGIPLVLDLYAHRLLESMHAEDFGPTITATLRALRCADVFLTSNPKQRLAWLGALPFAGIDLSCDPTLLIPLSTTQEKPTKPPKEPLVIAGGHGWAWRRAGKGIHAVLEAMDKADRGTLELIGAQPVDWGGIKHPRLKYREACDHDSFREHLRHATAAFDLYEHHPEREIALAFRHMDYLGCALPILTTPATPLADILGDAGWANLDISEAMNDILHKPRTILRKRKAARVLAANHFDPTQTIVPLLDWLESPTKASHRESPLHPKAQIAHELKTLQMENTQLETAHGTMRNEVLEKREEIKRLNLRIETLLGALDRMGHALEDVTGFKREATQILGGRIEHATRSSEEMQRENAILRADIEKKSAELLAMDQLRERLENDLHNLRTEKERERRSSWPLGRR